MTAGSTPPDPLNAFCSDEEVVLPGAGSGPLAGLTFAAKDVFDVAGHTTGGGNPDWRRTHGPARATAWAVRVLVEDGATMVGKTITDELTRGILGDNVHFGMPTNPRAPGRVPGGSSSGSAAAVAGGLVDFALGTDTGGSVRAPASFCGLFGLRPTHGRIPMDGVIPNAPTFDTVGFFARGVELFAKVGAVLLQTEIPRIRPRRLVIADDAFGAADPEVREALQPAVEAAASLIGNATHGRLGVIPLANLPDPFAVLQGSEAWHSYREWIEEVNPRLSFEVAARFVSGREVSDELRAAAQRVRDRVETHLRELTGDGAVVCLPTAPFPAPERGLALPSRRALHYRLDTLLSSAGLAGTPQVTLPVAEVSGLPIGLSFIGAKGSDEMLIALASELPAGEGPPP